MRYFILLLILIFSASSKGQSLELPIGLTDDEKLRIKEIYSMGRDTDPPLYPIRNIAEFERRSKSSDQERAA